MNKDMEQPGIAADADAATLKGAAFTPGPWRINVNGSDRWSVDFDGPSSAYVTISGGRKEPIAFAVEPSAYGVTVDANARLIAAAPELLECLRETKELFRFALLSTSPEIARDGMVFIRKAEAAIAKATGGAA